MLFPHDILLCHPAHAARKLLGAYLHWNDITLQITELEAYGTAPDGPWPDPASHCYPGPTIRNKAMYGPPGHLYTYLSYGIHICGNITCGPEGIGCGLLIRAGKVTEGEELARQRRKSNDPIHKIASGPGRVGQTLGFALHDNGSDLSAALEPGRSVEIAAGPRIGITKNTDAQWRLWIPGEPSVTKAPRLPIHH